MCVVRPGSDTHGSRRPQKPASHTQRDRQYRYALTERDTGSHSRGTREWLIPRDRSRILPSDVTSREPVLDAVGETGWDPHGTRQRLIRWHAEDECWRQRYREPDDPPRHYPIDWHVVRRPTRDHHARRHGLPGRR